jgi:hypothetical protein
MRINTLFKKHVGADIYVVGTGPTTRLFPKNFFKGRVTIGLNQAYKLIEPMYSITVHPELELEYRELIKAKKVKPTKWLVKHKAPTFLRLNDPSIYVFHTSYEWKEFIGGKSDTLFLGKGIQLTAIDLACRMGARSVILVGVDLGDIAGDHHGHDQHIQFHGLSASEVYREYRLWTYKARRLAREKAGVAVLSLYPLLGCGGDVHQEDYAQFRKELGLSKLPKPKDISKYYRSGIELPFNKESEMSRYDHLTLAVNSTINESKKNKPYRILDIGVYNADRAVSMIALAKKLGRTNIEYYGFDVFEDITEAIKVREQLNDRSAPISRDAARKKITAAGASLVQLIKGDTRETLPTASADMPNVTIVSIDGGRSPETIASDFAYILRLCVPGTKIVINNCIQSNYSVGSAFLSKSYSILKDNYGVTLEEVLPSDEVEGGHVRCILASCDYQLTPTKLEGLKELLLLEASPLPDPEPQEFNPIDTFIDNVPSDETIETKSAKEEEASPVAVETFPASGGCCNTDVQSVRLCEDSCGKPAGELCEQLGGTCRRREPVVESCNVGHVSEAPSAPVQVREERQEPDKVVEQGDTASVDTKPQDNSSGELRPEVPTELDTGNRRGSRRRRRRSGSDDECTGPQS